MQIDEKTPSRIEWIDLLKGVAVLLMILFHAGFDLAFLKIAFIETDRGVWLMIARLVQFIFIGTVGISLSLSYFNSGHYTLFFKKQATRSLKLFLIALMITGVTKILLPDVYIRFGILHLISISILIGAALIRFPRLCLILAVPSFYIGMLLKSVNYFLPDHFATLDFFPVFPWISLVFIGIWTGYFLKEKGLLNPLALPAPCSPILFLGRHSLMVYLIHQPVLIGLLWILFKR